MGIGDESGIFYNRFKDGKEKRWLKEKIYLGNTPYDINSVNEIFKLYIPFWLGRSYNLFQKNCNNFTKFFASLLLRNDTVINYPDYVNRITIFAQYFNMFYNPIKKLYYSNNSPSISSSLNSEFLSNENKESNTDNGGGNSSNKELNTNSNNSNNKESTESNVEINNNIKQKDESKNNINENKEENNSNDNNKNEIKKEKENNGG